MLPKNEDEDTESKESFDERLEKIQEAYEIILDEQIKGISSEDVYKDQFDYRVEIDTEVNLAELTFAVQFMQENLEASDPYSSVLIVGLINSLITSLPDEEFDKVVNGVGLDMDNVQGVSFQ